VVAGGKVGEGRVAEKAWGGEAEVVLEEEEEEEEEEAKSKICKD